MKDLSIIIVNFNTKDFVTASVRSIISNYSKEISSQNFEIIVVDNNSIDGSIESLGKIKEVTLIKNFQNIGFSKANNIAVKKSEGRYVLFLNPDTIVHKETLPKLINFMDEHSEAGAATCKILLPNGKIDDASHRGFPTPWNVFSYWLGLSKIFPNSKIFSGYNQGWKDLENDHEIDALAGAFMFTRRSAGEQIDWWDEDYFFYGEDIDFCYRLKKKGWKIYYLPSFSILHFKGISSGIKKHSRKLSTADKKTRELAMWHRFNAMKIFYNKHYESKYPWLITLLVKLGINIKMKIAFARL